MAAITASIYQLFEVAPMLLWALAKSDLNAIARLKLLQLRLICQFFERVTQGRELWHNQASAIAQYTSLQPSNLRVLLSALPKLLWASAKSGFSAIALLPLVSASLNLPSSWSVTPKL